MKRIVSFSLYGTSPLYLQGALRNVRLIRSIYPGWTARVYASEEIPEDLLSEMRSSGAEIVRKLRTSSIDGMFWRFLPAGEADVDAMIVRDVDSRVTAREFAAVSQWIDSGKTLHILRDHPYHRVVMLGGMWGCRRGAIADMQSLIARWKLWAKKGQDQDFLRDVIYPRFRNDCFVHSDLFAYGDERAEPFPLPRNRGEFVGCVYQPDRDTLTEQEHRDNARLFDSVAFRRLPAARVRLKAYLVAEQWLRNLRSKYRLAKSA